MSVHADMSRNDNANEQNGAAGERIEGVYALKKVQSKVGHKKVPWLNFSNVFGA